jgi:glucan phosphoethanolaminetransferase (alkaline phosphatase superfamily)
VLIISTTSTLNDLAYTQIFLWIPLMFGLMIVLGVFALIRAKRLPKMILQPPKINVALLLNFAFRFNQTFSRSKLYRHKEEREESKANSKDEEANGLHHQVE